MMIADDDTLAESASDCRASESAVSMLSLAPPISMRVPSVEPKTNPGLS
jgi:hypothetical protein